MNDYKNERNGVFPSVCSLDCPDQCGLLIHKENGKITKVEGDPGHPVTQGSICNKVRHMTERLYDEERLTCPLKRIGKKGEARFQPVTWKEAISTITGRWKDLSKNYGAESILPHGFYGNMGRVNAEGMDRRFFNRLGASQLERTICSSAGAAGYTYTMGGGFGTDPEETIHSKLIIFWGINAVSTNMHQVALAQKARKNGATIVTIDVHKNKTGRFADWFIPVKPGTDAALALGLMHVLFRKNLQDDQFLHSFTKGHQELRDHVKDYPPERVSAITGVPIEDLYRLAELYGETSPAFIRIGNGIQHHDNGGMCVRTIACLPAITGQWKHKGGGAIKSNLGYMQLNESALQADHLRPDHEVRSINMNTLGKALLSAEPPIKSLFIYNSNPAVVTPDTNNVVKGLEREDLFTVVHDLFLTESARYADIVLPATSSFENMDLYTSYWHHYLHLQAPVIPGYGQSKSNAEVFRLLAEGMGYKEPALFEKDEDLIYSALNNPENPYFTEDLWTKLKEDHFAKREGSMPIGRLPTPSGKIELYSETMEKDGLPPLPTYVPNQTEEGYEYTFIPGPNHSFLNSTFSSQEKHQQLEKEPKLFIHNKDAAREGIESGDSVIVWNDRGMCELPADVGDHVLEGVLVCQGLWPKAPVNALTPDRIADMGGGAVFFSGKVNIKSKENGNSPKK
ncbi:molybdopterin-dependent oxidoreductase [Halobacillus salinarum]|uniref:Molybdopterin-dependent oxidoreductase n=1 Tax=Halobacillus salinarum TaxID=2932257 RepID=A0ABY4END2_9BACI|nr:molybdopterin-dependent oxidoreductase [Halobacillus salinarum]UOQ45122.1 molybdopterin-dependent oxidoreductase [Halobacillus salinarum]